MYESALVKVVQERYLRSCNKPAEALEVADRYFKDLYLPTVDAPSDGDGD